MGPELPCGPAVHHPAPPRRSGNCRGCQGLRQLPVDVSIWRSRTAATLSTWAQARAAAETVVCEDATSPLSTRRHGRPSQIISANPARAPANEASRQLRSLFSSPVDSAPETARSRRPRGPLSADLSHNATGQNVVLGRERVILLPGQPRADGRRSRTVETARSNLAAAERRHDVGLATIDDVLPAHCAGSGATRE